MVKRKHDVCGVKGENSKVVLPEKLTLNAGNETCNLLKGKISEYLNKDELDNIRFLEKYEKCSHFWTPYSGELR